MTLLSPRKAGAASEFYSAAVAVAAATAMRAAVLGTGAAAAAGTVVATVYGGKYLYERLTWTNEAKGRAFKRQFVAHGTTQLQLIVDQMSADCSKQVEQ